MSTAAMTRDHRIALRVTARQKATIEQAASVAGGSLTDFAVHAMLDRAQEVLADKPFFDVDPATWDEFIRLLDAPVTPVPAMTDLLTRHTILD